MLINPVINRYTPHFGNNAQKKAAEEQKYKNPIKPGFEYVDAVKATMGAAVLYLGKIALDAIAYGDIDDMSKAVKKLKNKTNDKHIGVKLFAIGAVLVSGTYFLTHLPKNLYNKKKEIFVKKKEWDIYTRNNSAEASIYDRLSTEAQTADEKRKQELAKEFLKMRSVRNMGATTAPPQRISTL